MHVVEGQPSSSEGDGWQGHRLDAGAGGQRQTVAVVQVRDHLELGT